MQTGFAPGVTCCGCKQHKLSYILFSEVILAPILRMYDPYVVVVIKGGMESNCGAF